VALSFKVASSSQAKEGEIIQSLTRSPPDYNWPTWLLFVASLPADNSGGCPHQLYHTCKPYLHSIGTPPFDVCFLYTRLRLCRHLHKHLKHCSEADKKVFDTEFSTVPILRNLGSLVSQNSLLAEIYWYPKEMESKRNNIQFVRSNESLLNDFCSYDVDDIITLISHFESHA